MDTPTDPLIGRIVDQRYRVEAFVARGGMATVYRATDLRLERIVALKIMHGSLAEDPDFVARFVTEARSAAQLSHPAIVAVYDQGGADGLVYLAMEYVQGQTLRDVLAQRGRLHPIAAAQFFEPILAALTAAHNAGIVHRDVKPENVLVSTDGRVKVADFGLARAIAAGTTSAATRGMLIGTVAYLAPEQVEHGVSDARTDVYAAGIMLYECIVGQAPYTGETPLAIAYKHVNATVPVPSSIRSDVPPVIDELVAIATSREPAARYPNAGHFLNHLRSAIALLSGAPAVGQIKNGGIADGGIADGNAYHTIVLDRSSETVSLMPATAVLVGAGASALTGQGRAATSSTDELAVTSAPSGSWQETSNSPGSGATPQAKTDSQFDRIRPPGKHRAAIALIGLVLLGLVTGGGAWVWGATQYVAIPSLVGMTPTQASAELAKQNLRLTLTGEQFSETVAKGSITATDPSPGGKTRKDGTVQAAVSKGPERHVVPTVAGMSLDDATKAITDAKLTVIGTTSGFSDTVTTGLVADTAPAVGAALKPQAGVTLVISDGPAPVAIPKVAGLTTADAVALLQKNGLKATPTQVFHDKVAAGNAIATDPQAGTTIHRGDTVTLIVSKGPPPVTVPNVVTMDTSSATARLKAAGLKVVIKNRLPVVVLGRVYSQDPGSGAVVPKGSTVTITIV